MYKISKEFEFAASHQLEGLPDEHPCSRIHGHNYKVIVELSNAVLDSTGFVVDYRELSVLKDWINDTLDHKHLNDILPFNPTAENMAEHFYNMFRNIVWQVTAVTVCETSKTTARYEPSYN